ncbi:MAG: alpha/beta fold hydrolase, partial [Hyphomicrobiaceae bacterium]
MIEWAGLVATAILRHLPSDPHLRLLVLLGLALICLYAPLAIIHHRQSRLTARRAPLPSPEPGELPAPKPANRPVDPEPERPVATPARTPVPNRQHVTPQRLIVFIHGLLGSGETTWGQFPALLRAHPELVADYDVMTFGYRSGILELQQVPTLEQVAQFLDLEVETKLRNYSEIVLVAHSMGGLVARRYLANALERASRPGGAPCRVSRVLYFATPHRGSVLPTIADLSVRLVGQLASYFGSALGSVAASVAAGGVSSQLRALAGSSDFLFNLERDEERLGARDRLCMWYVIAESDLAVDRNSGVGSSNFLVA